MCTRKLPPELRCAVMAMAMVGVSTATDPLWAAGNVSVEIAAGGDLLIDGDESANHFIVKRVDGNTFTVSGGLDSNGEPTTVEGQSVLIVEGVTGGIFIDARQGDDHVEIDDVGATTGEILINGGRGDDRIDLGNSVLNHDVKVVTGPGDDTVGVEDVQFQRDLVVTTGSGSDTLSFFFVQVFGKTKVKSGAGGDELSVAFTSFDSLTTSLGGDDDFIEISSSSVEKRARVNGGRGTDLFVDDDSSYGRLSVVRVEIR